MKKFFSSQVNMFVFTLKKEPPSVPSVPSVPSPNLWLAVKIRVVLDVEQFFVTIWHIIKIRGPS